MYNYNKCRGYIMEKTIKKLLVLGLLAGFASADLSGMCCGGGSCRAASASSATRTPQTTESKAEATAYRFLFKAARMPHQAEIILKVCKNSDLALCPDLLEALEVFADALTGKGASDVFGAFMATKQFIKASRKGVAFDDEDSDYESSDTESTISNADSGISLAPAQTLKTKYRTLYDKVGKLSEQYAPADYVDSDSDSDDESIFDGLGDIVDSDVESEEGEASDSDANFSDDEEAADLSDDDAPESPLASDSDSDDSTFGGLDIL